MTWRLMLAAVGVLLLPLMLALRRSAELAQTHLGQRWHDVEDVKLVSRAASSAAQYADATSEQTHVIIARRDFDGDAFEDLLLLSERERTRD